VLFPEFCRHPQCPHPSTSSQIIAAALTADIQNLEATKRALISIQCDRAVSTILNADRIYVVGFGASAYLDGMMALAPEPFCRTVFSVAGPGGPTQAGRQFFKVYPRDATRQVVMDLLPRYHGYGGLIAIDALGNVTLPFNTEGMSRGFAKVGDLPVTVIYR
jgi:isoaspartyl peptidase/L-asparaginase-like protein (Ntn-hydrolase superfamily)